MLGQSSLHHVDHTGWNQALGDLTPMALAAALLCCGAVLPVWANPQGGVAIHGQATFDTSQPNTLLVTTQNGAGTNHSAINWQSFSIPAGSTTQIVQPSATSMSINRVVTNTPSALFGTLRSNGQVVLVNQAGIAVGSGAVVDTAGFTASAVGMTANDAVSGRLRFAGDGFSSTSGALTVQGNIIARGGDVVLIAPSIEVAQTAVVEAQGGSVVLAAGQSVEVTGRGLEGITLQVQAPADQALNLGSLRGDAVGIFAGTLKHSGVIQATTASLEGGKVVLKASGDALVEGAGKILASGLRGGSVDVLGQRVAVTDQAVIDVSGAQGGGSVRIGGDYQGKNTAVQNASVAYFGQQAFIQADATLQGDGGRVIIWADDTTRAYGSISAQGGAQGGNGGFVENSGHRYLDFQGHVDTRAPIGLAGTLLLDPSDITINNGVDVNITGLGTGFLSSSPSVNSVMTWSTINSQLGLGNLEVRTDAVSTSGLGDINITASGSVTGTNTLTLLAHRAINISPSVSVGAVGDINLVAGWNSTGWAVSPGANKDIVLGTNSSVSTSGNVWLNAGNAVTQDVTSVITANQLTVGNTNGSALPGGTSLLGVNMVNTLAAQSDGGGAFSFKNGKALTVGAGAFGINGIVASGNPAAINISTTVGDLTVANAIVSDSTGGAPITLTAAGTLKINAAVTSTFNATPNGPIKFVAGSGGIASTASGVVTTDTLELISGGSVSLNAPNVVTTLAANVTGSGLSFTNSNSFSVGVAGGTTGVTVASGDVLLTASGLNRLLTIGSAVQATNGNVSYVADNLALTASTSSSTAAGKYVEVKPYTAATAIEVVNTADTAGILRLSGAELNLITTPLFKLGNSAVTGGITFNQAVAPANFAAMSLITSGAISQSGGSTITLSKLNADGAGGVSLTGSNSVTTLAGHTNTGNFSFTNSGSLSLGAVDILTGIVSDGGGNITLNTGSTLTLGAVLKTSGAVSLTSSGGSIVDGDGIATNIFAGSTTLSAYSGIGVGDAIEIKTSSLSASNTMVNDIVLDVSGPVTLGTLTPASGARWLVYAATNTDVVPGSVVANFTRYGATYATYPSPTETGNGFIFASAPVGTTSPANLVSTYQDMFETPTLVAFPTTDEKEKARDAIVVEGEICKP